ncbi:MAG: JAB domain-containing protein, partial [Myxococcota bacterium]
LFGTGDRNLPVTELAHRVLGRAGGLAGLERLGTGGLAELRGVGVGKACRVVAALELGRRVASTPFEPGTKLASSREVDAAVRSRLAPASVEQFLAIPLDAKNRVLGELRLAVGGLTVCPVAPADVFRALLREAAAAVVFVHNHPSGEPSPSPEDVALTERLRRAGELLGVRVVDHVIVGREGYFSFLDSGLLASEEARP